MQLKAFIFAVTPVRHLRKERSSWRCLPAEALKNRGGQASAVVQLPGDKQQLRVTSVISEGRLTFLLRSRESCLSRKDLVGVVTVPGGHSMSTVVVRTRVFSVSCKWRQLWAGCGYFFNDSVVEQSASECV